MHVQAAHPSSCTQTNCMRNSPRALHEQPTTPLHAQPTNALHAQQRRSSNRYRHNSQRHQTYNRIARHRVREVSAAPQCCSMCSAAPYTVNKKLGTLKPTAETEWRSHYGVTQTRLLARPDTQRARMTATTELQPRGVNSCTAIQMN